MQPRCRGRCRQLSASPNQSRRRTRELADAVVVQLQALHLSGVVNGVHPGVIASCMCA